MLSMSELCFKPLTDLAMNPDPFAEDTNGRHHQRMPSLQPHCSSVQQAQPSTNSITMTRSNDKQCAHSKREGLPHVRSRTN